MYDTGAYRSLLAVMCRLFCSFLPDFSCNYYSLLMDLFSPFPMLNLHCALWAIFESVVLTLLVKYVVEPVSEK